MSDPHRYKVRLEFRHDETITVEAEDETEAEALALSEVEVSLNEYHYSTIIKELGRG